MILNCKEIRENKLKNIKMRYSDVDLSECVVKVVQVGDVAASTVYVTNKIKTCKELGLKHELIKLDEYITEQELLDIIHKLNDGTAPYLIQLPLPEHINEQVVINAIKPELDIDGFTKTIKGSIVSGDNVILPCTVQAVIDALEYKLEEDLRGCKVVICGKSQIVGMPLVIALMHRGCTVTSCNSQTDPQYMAQLIADSDILISAINRSDYFNQEFFTSAGISLQQLKNVMCIDVGIDRIDGKLHGNVDKSLVSIFQWMTSCGTVDGEKVSGVGSLTTLNVVENAIKLYNNLGGTY